MKSKAENEILIGYLLALFLDKLVGEVGLLHVGLGDFDFFLKRAIKKTAGSGILTFRSLARMTASWS
jgi:hypothetical protein